MTNRSLIRLLAAALLFCCAVGVLSVIASIWAAAFGWTFGLQMAGASALTALLLIGALVIALTFLRTTP